MKMKEVLKMVAEKGYPKCSCGGDLVPIERFDWDAYPTWIRFKIVWKCSKCGKEVE